MSRILLACALLAAALPLAATAQADSTQNAPPYKVGDRLPGKAARGEAGAASAYREVKWDELISPDWKPEAIIKALNLDTMLDSDPRAIAAMERLRDEWNRAPANPTLNGADVRLAGFVVPLERDGKALREFLLVPYFGACIHVPPPPANQVVHVVSARPIANTATMDAVWVSGKLRLQQAQTQMGHSGYRLEAAMVEPYRQKP
jgi:hypothetical protein